MAKVLEGVSRHALTESRAAVEEVLRGGAPAESLASELAAVADLLARSGRLRRALTDPAQSAPARIVLAESLLGSRVSAATLDVVRVLVRARVRDPLDVVTVLDDLSAQAQLALAEADGSLDEVEDELFRFGRTLDREPKLLLALTDPALPAERKDALVAALLVGKTRPVTRALVARAVHAPRGRSLDRVLAELSELAAQRRQRLVARVRVARPLSQTQTDRLAEALRRTYGSAIQLEVDVDPQILGGMVVRVGGEVVDGSIARRIAEARRQVTG